MAERTARGCQREGISHNKPNELQEAGSKINVKELAGKTPKMHVDQES